jgi:putative membrane protein
MGWEQSCENMGRAGTGHMWGGGMGMLGPLLGLLFFLGFLALLVVATIWLVRRTRRASVGVSAGGEITPGGTTPALDLIQNRLAAGEISIEEYRQLRDELRS